MRSSDSKRISVVLATYNGARFVEQQVKSLAAQRLPPCELIVADDRSTDETLAIVRAATAEAPFPVRAAVNPRTMGFRDNFLRAARLAQGDFVAFCDQDDVWSPDKLLKCAEMFSDDVHLVVHAANLIDDQSAPIGKFSQGITATQVKPALSYDPWWTFLGFSMVFRRVVLDLVPIEDRFIDFVCPPELVAHDRWIMFLCQMLGSTAEIEEPLVDYRQHASNQFGANLRFNAAPLPSLHARSTNYIHATRQMIHLIERLAPDTEARFPQFRRAQCLRFLKAALAQLEARHPIYDARSFIQAAGQIWKCCQRGVYRSVHDDTMRWRSLGLDFHAAAQHFVATTVRR